MAIAPQVSGDSADPKKIMQDLAQLAVVCQRLGIDLSKVSAMGQTIGGGKASTPLQTQNQSHSSYHEGGGTGYTNLAMGALAGSRTSIGSVASLPSRPSQNPLFNNLKYKIFDQQMFNDLDKGKILSGTRLHDSVVRTSRGEIVEGSIAYNRTTPWKKVAQRWGEMDRGELTNPDGTPLGGQYSYSVSTYKPIAPLFGNRIKGPSMAYNIGAGYGLGVGSRSRFLDILKDKEQRKFMKFFMGIEGARAAYSLMTKKIDYANGETFWNNAAKEATSIVASGVMMASGSYIHTVVAPAVKAAFKTGASMAVGGYLTRGVAGLTRAGSTVAGAAAPVALAASAIYVVSKAWDLNEEDLSSRSTLEKIKATTTGQMHVKKGANKFKLSEGGEYAFNAAVDQSQAMYYIDPETGERVERSGWSKWWYNRAFVRLWGRDADAKAEKEWRIKEANKMHESAQHKAQVLDWRGAKEDVAKARELIVVEEVMPFFWREPEKYLRSMEASRIAGRNWARAQQPRGGSRVGD